MATQRICSVQDCGKPVKSGGYCGAHYMRMRRNGSPDIQRVRKTCTIEGCDKPHVANGHCRMHYGRMERKGSLDVRTRRKEQVDRFIDDIALRHVPDECLRGPKGFNQEGYSYLSVDGYTTHVHRYLCEIQNGPAPEGYEASHECGNAWCWNLNHLSWKTPAANRADKERHGTLVKGEVQHRSILTEQKVREIREMAKAMNQREIARRLGVGHNAIWNVLHGKTWKHVT